MPRNLEAIVGDLNAFREEDFDYRHSPMTGPDRLDALCVEVASLSQPASAFPYFFRLMEKLSLSDLGSPGPLVHTMERQVGSYEDLLADSLERKPTVLSVWMVNRILNGKTTERGKWIALLSLAVSHPLASDSVIKEAQRFLDRQQRK